MDYTQNSGFFDLLLSAFQQMAHQIYNYMYLTERNSLLSPAERKSLASARFCSLQINRLCNICKYLSKEDVVINPEKLDSYEINGLMEEIILRFKNIVSSFSNISVSYESRLDETSLITISKTHFELLLLNLLYCCIKTDTDKLPAPVKITVSVTENKDYIVFHIHDNNKHTLGSTLQAALDEPDDIFNQISDNSTVDMIAMSLGVAQKSAREMQGKLSYKPQKGGNRYDIYLPKSVEVPTYSLRSPVRYAPTYEYYQEIFADLRLEYILSVPDDEYTDEFEGVTIL